MFPRKYQSKILVLAFGVLGAGCGETVSTKGPTDAQSAPPEADAERAVADSSPAIPDAATEPDAPDAAAMVPDAGMLTVDVALPDADGSDAISLDADLPDTADEEVGIGSPDFRGPRPNKAPTTVVLLPDTQYYSSLHPDIYASQSRWIVEQHQSRPLAMVLHVGDLVDVYNDARQWKTASAAMHAFDGRIPYTVTTGNHDTDAGRLCPISDYFVPDTMPWIAGTAEPGKIENNFMLVTIGPTPWLVLTLEFGPRDAVMTWADSVLKAYPERLAMIVTHAYLFSDGHRYDLAVSGLDSSKPNFQWFIPQFYNYTGNQGINDGEAMWQKLVVPNPNVRLVFSGHAFGAARLTSSRPDGTLVHQILSDYQWLDAGTANDLGGSGYLRIMEFDHQSKSIRVRTYSPTLNSYLTDDANQFTLSLEM